MRKVLNKTGIAAVFGVAILVSGLSGCSMFSPSNDPVDCDVVKTQAAAGKTDAQIASDLGSSVDKVAACHGPETSGNKSSGMIPSNY